MIGVNGDPDLWLELNERWFVDNVETSGGGAGGDSNAAGDGSITAIDDLVYTLVLITVIVYILARVAYCVKSGGETWG